MAFQLSCADSGASCVASFTADTKEELLEHVKVHAKIAHPEMKELPPAGVIESLLKKV